jgi:uncharacterized protein (TIGR00296 family)
MKKIKKTMNSQNSSLANVSMGYVCFDALNSKLNNVELPSLPDIGNESYPMFVTWQIGNTKKLRGCIGTFSATPLLQGLKEYAIISALQDTRFNPIAAEELPKLHVSVSILCQFEDATDFLDWELGVHGIRIYSDVLPHKSATYLPEVARDQGWNKVQTVDSLLRKGGFNGLINDDVRKAIKLVRYCSEKVSVSYADYLQYCKAQGR